MREGKGTCPNCGHNLQPYKTDRQQAGKRQILLRWLFCVQCRHVALQEWSFIHEDAPALLSADPNEHVGAAPG